MQETKFYYGKGAQMKTSFTFLAMGIFGLLFAYYSFFMETEVIYLWRRVASIFLILAGFGGFLYLMVKPKKTGEVALTINEKGIEGKTTAPSKAAGVIEWTDIEDIQVGNRGMRIYLLDTEKYRQRMDTFMAKDGFKAVQGTIMISLMEVDASREQVEQAIAQYSGY